MSDVAVIPQRSSVFSPRKSQENQCKSHLTVVDDSTLRTVDGAQMQRTYVRRRVVAAFVALVVFAGVAQLLVGTLQHVKMRLDQNYARVISESALEGSRDGVFAAATTVTAPPTLLSPSRYTSANTDTSVATATFTTTPTNSGSSSRSRSIPTPTPTAATRIADARDGAQENVVLAVSSGASADAMTAVPNLPIVIDDRGRQWWVLQPGDTPESIASAVRTQMGSETKGGMSSRELALQLAAQAGGQVMTPGQRLALPKTSGGT